MKANYKINDSYILNDSLPQTIEVYNYHLLNEVSTYHNYNRQPITIDKHLVAIFHIKPKTK